VEKGVNSVFEIKINLIFSNGNLFLKKLPNQESFQHENVFERQLTGAFSESWKI